MKHIRADQPLVTTWSAEDIIPPSPPVDFARNIGLNDPDRYRYAREKTQLRLLGRSLFELGQSSEYHSPRLRRILSCIGWFTDTFGLVRII